PNSLCAPFVTGIVQFMCYTIRTKCEASDHCAHTRKRLEACATRVGSRSHTEEECTEELPTCTGPAGCARDQRM
uniref:Ubiquinol-cytochrome C reductase hinge domain-containing protein n=1 Tax=Salmo trutta TaxID=8032 RepID=A0A674D1C6_SALTR